MLAKRVHRMLTIRILTPIFVYFLISIRKVLISSFVKIVLDVQGYYTFHHVLVTVRIHGLSYYHFIYLVFGQILSRSIIIRPYKVFIIHHYLIVVSGFLLILFKIRILFILVYCFFLTLLGLTYQIVFISLVEKILIYRNGPL